MALTADQRAYFRSQLGSTIDEVDLEERLVRLGTVELAAGEALRQMVADLVVGKPASFSVPGEYSEDRSANLRMMTARADALLVQAPIGTTNVVKAVNPTYSGR